MSMHFIVRIEARPGNEAALREEILRVIAPTRAEPGCLSLRVFTEVHEPAVFAIHSEWRDEDAFERHAALPHTLRFVQAAEKLTTRPIAGLRLAEFAADL